MHVRPEHGSADEVQCLQPQTKTVEAMQYADRCSIVLVMPFSFFPRRFIICISLIPGSLLLKTGNKGHELAARLLAGRMVRQRVSRSSAHIVASAAALAVPDLDLAKAAPQSTHSDSLF